jgi:hypothetical protein
MKHTRELNWKHLWRLIYSVISEITNLLPSGSWRQVTCDCVMRQVEAHFVKVPANRLTWLPLREETPARNEISDIPPPTPGIIRTNRCWSNSDNVDVVNISVEMIPPTDSEFLSTHRTTVGNFCRETGGTEVNIETGAGEPNLNSLRLVWAFVRFDSNTEIRSETSAIGSGVKAIWRVEQSERRSWSLDGRQEMKLNLHFHVYVGTGNFALDSTAITKSSKRWVSGSVTLVTVTRLCSGRSIQDLLDMRSKMLLEF